MALERRRRQVHVVGSAGVSVEVQGEHVIAAMHQPPADRVIVGVRVQLRALVLDVQVAAAKARLRRHLVGRCADGRALVSLPAAVDSQVR